MKIPIIIGAGLILTCSYPLHTPRSNHETAMLAWSAGYAASFDASVSPDRLPLDAKEHGHDFLHYLQEAQTIQAACNPHQGWDYDRCAAEMTKDLQ